MYILTMLLSMILYLQRDGTVELDLLDYQRKRTGEVASAHYSEVRPMVVSPSQRAMVVSGQKAGITGVVAVRGGSKLVIVV
jgi:hypothetical protein